ncbi:MAG: methylmalonyl-CoA epimerase [Ignavibacteria bacterium]|nr:methylmalonyl-CoA epimerase [Ignavibacteria bacterium]MBK6419065.1 methylmalonyl-CoA epimerase [Ignavibacteria bacterium]MBK7034009.1 methylmalonyl-CoA epimerase [Ignavibacteria bacterium]MBK7411969.1 methylmalonyl-CoA epimerase [Ignavibacteria bacterium]
MSAVDHIGIAVKDLEASMGLYRTIFGVTEFHREQVVDQGVDIASFSLNGVRIELTAPLNDESPIAGFIAKRGEGIHHIAFRTDAINDDLQRLAANDVRLINTAPQLGAHDMLIAFLHPKSTGGVLMELCSEK